MRNVGHFEKVSFEQFKIDVKEALVDIELGNVRSIEEIYNDIKLPSRATKGSAGYDFFFPFDSYLLEYGNTVIIPTGIKACIIDEWFLGLFPKSSFGNNYRIKLDDTVSVIDGDYFNCKNNEGHIIVKMTNNDKHQRDMVIGNGRGYCQGIFLEYGITDNDNATGTRIGGFGSTNK